MKQIVQISRDLAGLSGVGGFFPFKATMTATAEGARAADTIDVTVQITDARSRPLKIAFVPFYAYVGVDTAGVYTGGASITAANPTIASGSAQRVHIFTSAFGAFFVTDVNGQAVVAWTFTGTGTRRVVIVCGGAVIGQSGTLTWA